MRRDGVADDRLVDRYLGILGVDAGPPRLELLRRLTRAHVCAIPFENISKLYYLASSGLEDIPELERFLDGIERHHFGGTCYSNNIHLCWLLRKLGFAAYLCGADMAEPDVHIVIRVHLEGREWQLDAGYAAPFFEPIPVDRKDDAVCALGNERWIVRPPDATGRVSADHLRDGRRIHGYIAKPEPREPSFFESVIRDSFRSDSTFMNAVRVVRFSSTGSVAVSNLSLIVSLADQVWIRRIDEIRELPEAVEAHFGMPRQIVAQAIARVGSLRPLY